MLQPVVPGDKISARIADNRNTQAADREGLPRSVPLRCRVMMLANEIKGRGTNVEAVLDRAVSLRRERKMSLGDALIAGTALAFGRTLVTRNVKDFAWITGLSVLDPLASS